MSDSEMRLRLQADHAVIIGEPEFPYPDTALGNRKTTVDDSDRPMVVSVPLSGYHTIRLPNK